MIDMVWLRGLGSDGLERLLHRRPDVVFAPAPRSLTELAQRLSASWSVIAALRQLDRPTLQVAEALAGLGGAATKTDLARLLGKPKPKSLDRALSTLNDHGLLTHCPELTLVEAASAAWPSPLGLGPPVSRTLQHRTVDQLKQIAAHLGITTPTRRAEVLAAVATAIRDPDLVRDLVDRAPKPVRDELLHAAHTGEPIEIRSYLWYGSRPTERTMADRWGMDRGLLTMSEDDIGLVLVAEVALALRGPGYAAPFEPDPPRMPTTKADQRRVDDSGVAAITALGHTVTAVHDAAGHRPIAILKSGGIGTREMKRLAKESGCAELEVRLALTLGYHMRLLEIADQGVTPTGQYDDWLAAEPAQRLAALIRAAWTVPQIPLGEEGTWQPLEIQQVPELRQRILGEIPADATVLDAQTLASTVAWRYPYILGDPDVVRHFAEATWREMELAGIVAAGAITSAGKAVLAGGDVGATLTAVGSAQQSARFGADLTAVVTGTPAAALAGLLDTAADRESRGAASIWRFSQRSVRRALDAGHTGDELIAKLTQVATTGLPQPLDYLIRDEARRHGSVRVRAVVSCLHSDDEALLQRLTADRKLAPLQLRLLAPTVIACAKPVAETLAMLRSAGYSPMPEDDHGMLIIQPDKPARAGHDETTSFRTGPRKVPKARTPEQISPAELAKHLLAAPDIAATPDDPTLRQVQANACNLTQAEIRLLAHAIETGHPVTIGYVNRQGNETVREIEEPELIGGELVAWCRLRDDLRHFTLSRIFSVEPA
ncbi:MAG TPA: helicase-associated domain-containing protein [Candidatus Limnocylindrales bacterium]|nr:helicase-associated domain-containing protein [Candidatus Limnocylindrales bacterium]